MNKILDLSQHNGSINFAKIKKDGVDGVILRIGWIGNKKNHTIDKRFEEYYKQARMEGLKIGYYVYSYCNNIKAIEDACEWTYRQICNKVVDLPVFIDLEDTSIYNLDYKELTNHAVKFCKFFNSLGYKSGTYASKYWFYQKLDINKLLNYKIWLAEWNNQDKPTFRYRVDLWQYTSDGHVNGITGRVDMNKCMCECEENEEDFVMVKTYKNGSTRETVYADSNCTKVIGSLNKYEVCDCLGITAGKYIVRYQIDGANNYKIGFVKYNGGIV